MGILRERKRSKGPRPFIANWIDLEKEICMVVGVMMDSRNVIGTRFNEVAERLNISVNHDNFMANIIVIKRENLTAFIK
jgi:predicted component of type VI protein secretion system